MKKQLLSMLLLAAGLFFLHPVLSAQNGKGECGGCHHAVPSEVFMSTKNAVTVSGPPDAKGGPVEYQVFTQSRLGGKWKMEAAGVIDKPGKKETLKYYKPSQVMVLVFCGTPFDNMVEFSSVKVPAPSTTGDVIGAPPTKN